MVLSIFLITDGYGLTITIYLRVSRWRIFISVDHAFFQFLCVGPWRVADEDFSLFLHGTGSIPTLFPIFLASFNIS
jgi:hypothetical protein